MPTTKWIKRDSQSFYAMLKQLPDREGRPQSNTVQTPAVDFEASAWLPAAERAAHARNLAYGPVVDFSMPTQHVQRQMSQADAEALQRAIADEWHKRQQREATFAAAEPAAMTAAKRRELLGMTEAGREVLRREDAASAPSSTPSGMSEAERRHLLSLTHLGQQVLDRERTRR